MPKNLILWPVLKKKESSDNVTGKENALRSRLKIISKASHKSIKADLIDVGNPDSTGMKVEGGPRA